MLFSLSWGREGGGVAVRLDLRCRVEIAAVVKR